IRIHSIVMGGRLKPPKRDVKDPDTIRGAGSNHGLSRPGRWREAAARPSDGEPGATGAHRLSWPKAVSSGQVYRGRVRVQIYLVGGAVRDRLLGLPQGDRDHLVVGATVEEMLGLGFTQVGRDFPVFLHPKTQQEYALARTERKQGRGYTGFVCHASPEVT